MNEHPIAFSSEMVRAILEGRKTQTRRIVRPDYHGCLTGDCPHEKLSECKATLLQICRYGQPGDRLWVAESFYPMPHLRDRAYYRATDPLVGVRWKRCSHMPRELSRITLEVLNVGVDWLQDISQADAVAEGIEDSPDIFAPHAFSVLWERLYGPGAWNLNPFVYVITFKRGIP